MAIQNDPDGDHAFHEGLMVLIMNLLKAKKVDRPHFNKKIFECDTEGSDQDEGYGDEIKDEDEEMVEKKRKNLSLGSSSTKKSKGKEVDYEMETDFEEDIEKVIGKKTKGKTGIITRTKGKKIEKALNIHSDDEPLIQKKC